MALIEAVVLGGFAGTLVESGKRGLIKKWGNSDQLPPVVKVLMVAILIGIPAVTAGTFGHFFTTALQAVGAFTVARWTVASVIVLWRWRR